MRASEEGREGRRAARQVPPARNLPAMACWHLGGNENWHDCTTGTGTGTGTGTTARLALARLHDCTTARLALALALARLHDWHWHWHDCTTARLALALALARPAQLAPSQRYRRRRRDVLSKSFPSRKVQYTPSISLCCKLTSCQGKSRQARQARQARQYLTITV